MNARTKLLDVREDLRRLFHERNEVIDLVLMALLSKRHVVMLGTPGIAKTAVAEQLAKRITGMSYFYRLMTKATAPDELFGPVSVSALKADTYRRNVTGKLPEAHLAVADEVFKSNSVCLNSMLRVINERRYENDGTVIDCPLITLIGASNEMPQGEELAALWDRLHLRVVVEDIKSDANFIALIEGEGNGTGRFDLQPAATITLDELKAAQAEVEAVKFSADLAHEVGKLRRELAAEGITASPRRWKEAVRIVKAKAWLDGRDEARAEDLEVFAHLLWHDLSSRSKVATEVLKRTNPLRQQALEFSDMAASVVAAVESAEDKGEAALEARKKLVGIKKAINAAVAKAMADGRDYDRLTEVLADVEAKGKEIGKALLELALD
jgi:MoxR-like ATPase